MDTIEELNTAIDEALDCSLEALAVGDVLRFRRADNLVTELFERLADVAGRT